MRRDIEVDESGDGRIIRTWLADQLPEIPAKGIRRAIQRGQITVDGDRVSSNETLHKGQLVGIHIQDQFGDKREIPGMKVLFEDDDIAGIFKPAGIEVHGGRGPKLIGAIKGILSPPISTDALLNPSILHRLDKPTCGVLLVAKTKRALISLSEQFQSHTIKKEYFAITRGRMESETTIDSPVDGKEALTTVIPLEHMLDTPYGPVTIVMAEPKTGRKHQIRRHLASKGHPIIGDHIYDSIVESGMQLLLCARSITFDRPEGGTQTISCEVPDYFKLIKVN